MAEEQVQLTARFHQASGLGESVRAALEAEARRLGFAAGTVAVPRLDTASCSLQRDDFSGTQTLVCAWLDKRGQRTGSVVFHADGSFWAEYDVARPHPSDARWFVEAVTAWGRDGTLKAEARLLPALQ